MTRKVADYFEQLTIMNSCAEDNSLCNQTKD